MKSKLTNNIGWKIVSLLISIALWMVVNSMSNPSVTQTYYNVPVKLVNADKITASGRVYKILEGTDVVPRVVIKAPRSVISEIDEDDIFLTANVDNINKLDNVPIEFGVRVYSDQINSIKGSIDSVKLEIENKKIKTLALKAMVSGSLTDEYMVGDVSTTQNVVRITGAESIVNKVDTAVVEVDVTGFTTDMDTNTDIKLYDADGNIVDDDELGMNIKSVGAKIKILHKKVVPVEAEFTGQPADGYIATGEITQDVDEVTIFGATDVVKNIDTINLPKESLDITDIKENLVVKFNLEDYLPSGVDIADGESTVCTVTVVVERATTRSVSVTTEDIDIVNVPEGYKVTTAVDPGTKVVLSGLANDVGSLTVGNVNPVIDVDNWIKAQEIDSIEEGFYTAEVEFSTPNRVVIKEPVKAVIHIVKIVEEEENDNG